ncbi:MAG TPA: FAD-dependent oxidoreductase [Gammaproteobacteria bacterium]|nr:FAD-dependent oxidoreductase [Gammaproteobacteria bacterium]
MSGAHYDAIVIGGGVAGASTAILLASAGWSVAVIEKARFPRRKVCGECIAATNWPLLDALGVGAAVAASAGPPLERVGLYSGDSILTAGLPPLRGSAAPWGRALGREHLDTLLLRRAGALGARVFEHWAVKEVDRRGPRHVCRIESCEVADSRTLAAPLLVDAHGSWETGPGARPRARAKPSDLFGFKANFTGATLEPALLPVLAFEGGYGGMVIGDGGTLTIACCVRRDRLRGWRVGAHGENAGAAVERALIASCAGVRRALEGAQREGAWLSVGPIRPGTRSAWSERAGFAVGNAAGEAHPILGEGISMAIQSAFLLTGRLERARAELLDGRAQDAVARDYASAWRRNFGARLRWSGLLAALAMRPRAAAPMLAVLRLWPGLLTVAARVGGKVRPFDGFAAGTFDADFASDPSSTTNAGQIATEARATVAARSAARGSP